MSSLSVYKSAHEVLYTKLIQLKAAIEQLDQIYLTIDKADLTDLAIKQINKVNYSIEDQQTQINDVVEFLQSPDLACFESLTVPDAFKIRLFTAKGMEKVLFLGTPLDWFNISEQLSDVAKSIIALEASKVTVEEARLGVFDIRKLEVSYREKIIRIINLLRSCLVAVKGYALYRVESVLGASTDFYVKDLLPVCLGAMPVLTEMVKICEIPDLPLNVFTFTPETHYQITEIDLDTLKSISNC